MMPHLRRIIALVDHLPVTEFSKAILREVDRAMRGRPRACLGCEGRGTNRRYIDIAGDFTVHHCTRCHGSGKEPV